MGLVGAIRPQAGLVFELGRRDAVVEVADAGDVHRLTGRVEEGASRVPHRETVVGFGLEAQAVPTAVHPVIGRDHGAAAGGVNQEGGATPGLGSQAILDDRENDLR